MVVGCKGLCFSADVRDEELTVSFLCPENPEQSSCSVNDGLYV